MVGDSHCVIEVTGFLMGATQCKGPFHLIITIIINTKALRITGRLWSDTIMIGLILLSSFSPSSIKLIHNKVTSKRYVFK
jgi:hypothetical protein